MKRLIVTIRNHLVPYIKKNPISLVTMTISFATLVYILVQIPYIKKYSYYCRFSGDYGDIEQNISSLESEFSSLSHTVNRIESDSSSIKSEVDYIESLMIDIEGEVLDVQSMCLR
jgi:hypothetical protein